MSEYEYLGQRKHQPILGRAGSTPWDLAEEHRFRWMRLIPPREGGQRRGIIGIVGAGDGNALDINQLLDMFHEVHLIDPHESHMRQVIADQQVTAPHRVHFHWKTSSYSGVEESLAEYVDDPSDESFQKVLDSASQHTWGDIGQFSVIVSSSVLSPMLAEFADHFIDHPERYGQLLETVRGRHIELLLNHAAPQGAIFMLVRLVSSDTVPIIAQRPGDLMAICKRAIETQNFYAGCNPQAFERWLTENTELRKISSGFRIFEPWIYEKPDLQSVYYAVRMNRL